MGGTWNGLSPASRSTGLYTYQPDVPELLHTNSTIQREGYEVYVKVATTHMACYEARHKELLPMFVDGYEDFKARWVSGRQMVLDTAPKETIEMAELCLRWYALKQICELLERDGGSGGSVLEK